MPEPIRYAARTRRYYEALGFETAYRWLATERTPFATLRLPTGTRGARIATVTTASGKHDDGATGPGAPYNGRAKFFAVESVPVAERTRPTTIAHVAYDRDHTHAADERSWLPLDALVRARDTGRIGDLAPRLHHLPTRRSQRASAEADAPLLLERLREDGADAVVLAANCPVCHQSVTIAARHLEAAGLPTVVMGCAADIVAMAGAPRFAFSDFPLGNPAGRPFDTASQDRALENALWLLDHATGPASARNPDRWSSDEGWKRDYGRVDHLDAAALARLRRDFDREKARAAG